MGRITGLHVRERQAPVWHSCVQQTAELELSVPGMLQIPDGVVAEDAKSSASGIGIFGKFRYIFLFGNHANLGGGSIGFSGYFGKHADQNVATFVGFLTVDGLNSLHINE